ncbi:hypothetical protein [Ottowia testudinis]|uniref:Uncharacterized protein n=1 Tax=Ottowia testudinis TaxID=2816950 RepID=A0A975CH39_9BURK|nr:hypothetical protein [Ottowia testudinis]QTD44966.1 hypothetical protein J1M35_18250 [Ottowia testudinis]
MSYPFSNTFEQEPPAGYITPLGSMSASYNTDAQAIDLSASAWHSILRFNEAAHGDFWFEADVELLTDPSARKHLGLWMMSNPALGNGCEGYRFAHLDGGWCVTRWNYWFGDGAAVTGSINDGIQPMVDVHAAAPGFNMGERHTLRCEVITGAPDANGVPWSRLMQFKVDGVLLFQVSDASYRGKLVPGLFLYGATARVHGIAGGTPSGLPAFPNAVGVNADTDLGHLAGGSTSVLPDPASDPSQNIRVQPQLDLTRLNSPASAHWNRSGGYDFYWRAIPNAQKNIHFGGPGFIAGTVKEKSTPDHPLVRRVQLYSENTFTLVAETWSQADGSYRFELIDPTQRYSAIAWDWQHLYRAVIADNLKPQVAP